LMEFSLLIVKADFDGKKKTIILFKSSIASWILSMMYFYLVFLDGCP
jgi:hypothetical protein